MRVRGSRHQSTAVEKTVSSSRASNTEGTGSAVAAVQPPAPKTATERLAQCPPPATAAEKKTPGGCAHVIPS